MTSAIGTRSGQPVHLSGDASDPLDALMHRTHGEVLAPPLARMAGEADSYRDQVSTADKRRLTLAGLLSVHGMQADVLADVAGWDRTAGEWVDHYCSEALAGLDYRRTLRTGGDDLARIAEHDAEMSEPLEGGMPGMVAEYLLRLVHGPKAEYAAALAYSIVDGTAAPTLPATGWSVKCEAKVLRLFARCAA